MLCEKFAQQQACITHLVTNRCVLFNVKKLTNANIAVTTYIPPEESGLSKLVFKASAELVPFFCEPDNFALNFLWHTAVFLKSIERPGWSGYMANACLGNTLENQQ